MLSIFHNAHNVKIWLAGRCRRNWRYICHQFVGSYIECRHDDLKSHTCDADGMILQLCISGKGFLYSKKIWIGDIWYSVNI